MVEKLDRRFEYTSHHAGAKDRGRRFLHHHNAKESLGQFPVGVGFSSWSRQVRAHEAGSSGFGTSSLGELKIGTDGYQPCGVDNGFGFVEKPDRKMPEPVVRERVMRHERMECCCRHPLPVDRVGARNRITDDEQTTGDSVQFLVVSSTIRRERIVRTVLGECLLAIQDFLRIVPPLRVYGGDAGALNARL